jgi:photosystem II stability/assembly factor-like uncharacterized protein
MKKQITFLFKQLLMLTVAIVVFECVYAQNKSMAKRVKEKLGNKAAPTYGEVVEAYEKVKAQEKQSEAEITSQKNGEPISEANTSNNTKQQKIRRLLQKDESEDLMGRYLWQRSHHLQNKTGLNTTEAIEKAWADYANNSSRGFTIPGFTRDYWLQLGPIFTNQLNEGSGPSDKGVGRISCITFHPKNPNIFWVGTSSGGIWKTTNGGYFWQPLTDKLPVLRTSDIAVDPKNPDVMYVVTGDFDYYFFDFFFENSTSSLIRPSATGTGVYKSTDGGRTWNATGFNLPVSSLAKFRRLLINPANSNELLLFGLPGLFRSMNGGASWVRVNINQLFADVATNPLNPNTLYASTFSATGLPGTTSVFKSVDFGKTWRNLNTGLPAKDSSFRTEVAIAPSDTNYVYVIASDFNTGGFFALYRSKDAGNNWEEVLNKNSPKLALVDLVVGQGDYNLDLLVDPKDKDIIYGCGQILSWGIDFKDSVTVGATSFAISQDKKGVHADHHFIAYNRLSNNFYDCNDGGLHTTKKIKITPFDSLVQCIGPTGLLPCFGTENKWQFLSDFGLVNTEFYRIAVNKNIPFRVLGGTQDNSHFYFKNGQWSNISIADGMGVLRLYLAIQSGSLFRTDDGGKTLFGGFVNLTDTIARTEGGGAWITPFEIDPTDPNTIYTAFRRNVWKSTNRGESWQRISNFRIDFNDLSGVPLNSLAICTSNPNVMYVHRPNYNIAALNQKLYKTSNGGSTWEDITSNLSVLDSVNQISYLYVKDEDPNTVWATFNAFNAGKKVYESRDGGKTWKNISGSLPNVSANTIAYHKGSKKEGLYIGTDLGVFYKDSTMNDWAPYNKNLPNSIVYDLKIQYQEQAVYAGTYGRGIFRSQLNEFAPTYFAVATEKQPTEAIREKSDLRVFPTIANKSITVQASFDNDVVKTMEIVSMNGTLVRSWPAGVTNININLDVSTLSNGNYILRLQTLNGKTFTKKFVVTK